MTRESPFLIAHVLSGLRFGGNENLCLQLIKKSPELRHVLINIDPARVEMRDLFMSCPGVSIVDRPYSPDARPSFIAGMACDLRRMGASAVIVYPFGLHVFVALAARAVGIRNVLVHAGNPPPLDPKQRRLWKRIVLASHALAVPIKSCSTMVDRDLRALGIGLPAGSEPLLNGVDVETIGALAASARERKGRSGPRVVGMVARFNAIKDHDTLLGAFALVRRRMEDAELWLIGDGERRDALVKLSAELGITHSVRFWGERSDVHSLLGEMNVFVFSTTRDEGFGIALAEAMAARTPIVASDVGACREVLANGRAGKLVQPHDVHGLANAIAELLAQPEMAHSSVEWAYAYVKQQMDATACAERYFAALIPRWRRAARD